MKTKDEIVENWLVRYTKRPLDQFTPYILLTNFNNYIELFAEKFGVEVMGRNAGYLALYVGIAVGATAVLVPEIEWNLQKDVIEKIRQARFNGFTHYMIVVAEGAISAMEIAQKIKQTLDLDPRVTVLGHIQRGGTPTAHDRVLSSRYGYAAVELCMAGKFGRMVALQGDEIVDVSLEDVIGQKTKNVEPDGELVTLAKAMGVCFGD